MVSNKYSTIVFDLGNTLIRFDHNIAVGKLKDRFGIDPKTTYQMFFDSEITRQFEKGEITPAVFHKQATGLLGIRVSYKEFIDIWNDIFWEDEACCAIARSLKRLYKLFLLSNVNKVHFEYVRKRFDIIEIFDELVLSYKLGSMKPEKAIYDHVVKKAGGDRKKIVYIDDRDDLISQARRLGIESIKYEGADHLVEALKDRGIYC